MDNPIQNEAEMEELKYEESFASTEAAETREGTSMPPKDQDTILSIDCASACLRRACGPGPCSCLEIKRKRRPEISPLLRLDLL